VEEELNKSNCESCTSSGNFEIDVYGADFESNERKNYNNYSDESSTEIENTEIESEMYEAAL
jgi:hypothetical protein